ncbi:hypothetical protein CSUI_011527, partial [Cystoisospora suis]
KRDCESSSDLYLSLNFRTLRLLNTSTRNCRRLVLCMPCCCR